MNILEEHENGNIPNNKEIFESFLVANKKINDYKNIICSVSGGSDSDLMIDLFTRLDENNKVTFVFLNTGLEYAATKEHLKYLENKYGIKIVWINAKKPIPITCKEHGQPFLSKQVSEWIDRLQRHNFMWEDKSFEELYKEYPNCKTSLKWWCNEWGEGSKFNISYNKGLKEFMILNPPQFKISQKCCKFAKKDPVHDFIKENDFDLNCYGVRKAEGGTRSTAYANCFTNNEENEDIDEYRPIFWYKEQTKRVYESHFNIVHSKCYTKYGLTRTGCCGCPYNRDFEEELKVIEQYEPKLFKAVNNIFKESYEYTREYRRFVKENIKYASKQIENQLSIFDLELDIRVNVGDEFINGSNGVVGRVIKICKGEILTEQLKDGKRTYDIKFDLSWLKQLINNGTIRKIH
ncbi:phosphoadenosine phosphosulfate reductase family protein [Clostridium saccharobutylicum]|uniref:phosphoadenosine phosphosulfate reductase domain-containing protein n=1 Tax=Clostridium saccharobutylicum TaxID=169679 RepID=UPI00098CD633|nr:phosphoadenosine phosphosulfate reductase family protein [Clostridium saccharobutylicum]